MFRLKLTIMPTLHILNFKHFYTIPFLIIFSLSFQQAQSHCIHEDSDENAQGNCLPSKSYSFSTDPDVLAAYPEITVRIFFWGINQDNGESEDLLTEDKIQESMDLLNSAYGGMNICFELKGYDHINDSSIYWGSAKNLSSFLRKNKDEYQKDDAVNIYIPYKFTNFKNNLRGINWGYNKLAVNMLNYNTGILPHEVGHSFRLKHTHQNYKTARCEHVTRDPDDPDFNAKCAGDHVVDTNAMPNLYGSALKDINEDCEYTGNPKDCQGTPYAFTSDDVRNFMAYTKQSCRSIFTTGQGIRVRESIELLDFYQKIISNSETD